MMSSHYDATLNMTNTSTGIRDKMMCISCLITTSVTIHTTSLSCPALCALTQFMLVEFHFFAVVCHLLKIGINKVTGHPCVIQSDDVVCVYISCLDTITDGRNSEGIAFPCLSHLSEERTPYQNRGMWLYLCCLHVLLCRLCKINF